MGTDTVRKWHTDTHTGKGTSATTGLEYDSVGSPGCRIWAHRWRGSENRSLPCLNSAVSHCGCALRPTWTHMTTCEIERLTLQGKKRRGYGPTWPPLFPVQTSHAKSYGSSGFGVKWTPRQCVAFSSFNAKYTAWKNMSMCLERRSVPRPLSGFFLSMEKSNISWL